MAGWKLLGLTLLAAAGMARAGAPSPPPADPSPAEATQTGAPNIDAADYRIGGETIYGRQGRPVVLFHYFSIGPDCAARPVSVTLKDPPAHGRMTVVDGAQPPVADGRAMWGPGDPRAHCAGQLVATRDGAYQPDPAFVGHDRLTVSFREGDVAFDDVIEVNVVRIGGGPAPFQDDRRYHAAADTPRTPGG